MLFHLNDYGTTILEEPDITGLHKLPYHAPLPALDDPLAPLEESPYRMSLDGHWDFSLCSSVAQVPERFWECADIPWSSISVPANWQVEGFGRPHYLDAAYIFEPDSARLAPPRIPAGRNAAGLYRTRFVLPAAFGHHRTLLSFDGVESALFVWVNGRFAGSSANGRSPAQFDITDFLQPGENILAACVTEYQAASYLEDQDFVHLSGIIRSVDLIGVPDVQLWDCFAWASFGPDGSAKLHLEVKVLNHTDGLQPPCHVTAALYDPQGMKIGEATGVTGNLSDRWEERGTKGEPQSIQGRVMATAHMAIDAGKARRWSCEQPVLHTVALTLHPQSPDAPPVMASRLRFGFREVEIRDSRLYINGIAVRLRGVNRNETYPRTGHAVDRAMMRRDIELMKSSHINAVRCSHYPNDEYWYDLCDEYGLYVMDEANAESHEISYRKNVLPGNDPRWRAAYMDRISAMVQTHKNHPCVIMWSLGNEIGFGENVAEAAAYCRTYDPTRLVHKRQMNKVADFDSENYMTVEALRSVLAERPGRAFLLTEYAHAIGNGMHDLGRYWDVILSDPRYMGGFIWEWCDHGLERFTDDGTRYLASGDDFGTEPNTGNYCMDGIVTSDRTSTAKLAEVKKVFEPVRITMPDPSRGVVHLHNRSEGESLSRYILRWMLLADGVCVAEGSDDTPAALPGGTDVVRIPFPTVETGDAETVLEVSLRYRHDTPWCPAGSEAAFEQFILRPYVRKAAESCSGGDRPQLTDGEGRLRVAFADTEAVFVPAQGRLEALSYRGEPYLTGDGVTLCVYRAPTDGDACSRYLKGEINWNSAGLATLVREGGSALPEPAADGSAAVRAVQVWRGCDCRFTADILTTLRRDGVVWFDVKFLAEGSLPPLPRIAVLLRLPQSFDATRWYGHGPMETYEGRWQASRLGIWEQSVADGVSPDYEKPQECGNHREARWFEIESEKLRLRLVPNGTLSFSACPYTPQELARASHRTLLPRPEASWVCVNAHVAPFARIASRMPDPDIFEVQHRIERRFSFRIEPARK